MKCETRTPKVRCHFVQLRVDKFRHSVGGARYIYFGVARRKCFRCGRGTNRIFNFYFCVREKIKKSELFLPWRQIEWRACSPQFLAGPFYVANIDQHWRKTEYGTNVPNELSAQTTYILRSRAIYLRTKTSTTQIHSHMCGGLSIECFGCVRWACDVSECDEDQLFSR